MNFLTFCIFYSQTQPTYPNDYDFFYQQKMVYKNRLLMKKANLKKGSKFKKKM